MLFWGSLCLSAPFAHLCSGLKRCRWCVRTHFHLHQHCQIVCTACFNVCRHLMWGTVRSWVEVFLQRMCCCCASGRLADEECNLPYDDALKGGQLQGVLTYRLPHHPHYANLFNGRWLKLFWRGAQGRHCYTRLVSNNHYITLGVGLQPEAAQHWMYQNHCSNHTATIE